MHNSASSRAKYPDHSTYRILKAAAFLISCCSTILAGSCHGGQTQQQKNGKDTVANPATANAAKTDTAVNEPPRTLDTALYNHNLQHLVNGDSSGRWPVKTAYPLPGAILPFKRIVAYYGNLYSKNMGVLGEYPPAEMYRRLDAEVKKWAAADTTIPIQPALHYICVTAQGSPGKDGKYRARMPFKQIDSVLHMAERIHAIVFLDIQVGFSNVQAEVPPLEKYLKMPQVHLGIDPEFSMKTGKRPGKVIGTMDAADVNFCTNYLAKLVRENNLPPKILVVHRFTRPMITNYRNIQRRPEVQIVMDMDGWGEPSLKHDSYHSYVSIEPVQFTGFKLFYKNDIRKKGSHMLTPQEVLRLKPQPIYIQYQ
ncbi:MAG: hypothetical protein Q8937_03655 [Bacteroidota bacterium]|nr:hypothetical protein [Bacteroidota bacterium]